MIVTFDLIDSPGKRENLPQLDNERFQQIVGDGSSFGERLGSSDLEPQKPISKPIGTLGFRQVTPQFVLRNVSDDADVCPSRSERIATSQRGKITRIPPLPDDPG